MERYVSWTCGRACGTGRLPTAETSGIPSVCALMALKEARAMAAMRGLSIVVERECVGRWMKRYSGLVL